MKSEYFIDFLNISGIDYIKKIILDRYTPIIKSIVTDSVSVLILERRNYVDGSHILTIAIKDSDSLINSLSSITYHKNRNLDVKLDNHIINKNSNVDIEFDPIGNEFNSMLDYLNSEYRKIKISNLKLS